MSAVQRLIFKREKLEALLAEAQILRVSETTLDSIIDADDPLSTCHNVALSGAIAPLLRQAIKRCKTLESDLRLQTAANKHNETRRVGSISTR